METLTKLRKELDQLDEEIMTLLARRFATCRQVAVLKAEQHIPTMQPSRVAEARHRAVRSAIAAGMTENFGLALYGLIVSEGRRMENEILTRRDGSQEISDGN